MFFDNLLLAARQVCMLFILVAIGFIADKTKVYPEKAGKMCIDLLFYIITPAVIIKSFMEIDYSPETAKKFFVALGCGMLIHIVASVMLLPFFRRGDQTRSSVFKFASIFGNCGYMSLPLVSTLLGAEGVFYCSAVIMAFHVFVFTYGISILSDADENGKKKIELRRIILNPGTISIAIALPLFLLRVKLPEVLFSPLSLVGNMNTPMAMLIFGTFLANTNMRSMFKEWRIYIVALFKLCLVPLAMFGIFRLMGLSGTLLVALVIPASAPSANNTVMFSSKFNKDTGLASQTVALVSFISIITMPVMIALSQSA